MFLQFIYTGDTAKDAEMYANQAQKVISFYGGSKAFAGIVFDSTVSSSNTYMISLNDETDLPNLLLNDVS